ncbi:MAG: ATP-binding protein [Vicinamibacteria bacterium]
MSKPLPPAALADRIRDALKTLGLRHAATQFDKQLADPAPDVSRLEWLWRLVEPQLVARVEARFERRFRESRLPERKTLEGFDAAFQPDLDWDLVLELGTLGFVDEGKNVLLAGMSGTGKSHIAKALALNACLDNRRVRYTTSAEMLTVLNASLADETLNQAIKPYANPDLLVIDEVGLEQVERTIASRAGLMQKVLLPRYGDKNPRSTIITSNIPWSSWGDYLEDHLGATALLDRLLHHSHVIVINGPSYRDHVHQQEVADAQKKRVGRKPPPADVGTDVTSSPEPKKATKPRPKKASKAPTSKSKKAARPQPKRRRGSSKR